MTMPPEPAEGGVVIGFRTEGGQRILRRFCADAQLQDVYDYAALTFANGTEGSVRLTSDFPHVDYGTFPVTATLEECGIHNRLLMSVYKNQ